MTMKAQNHNYPKRTRKGSHMIEGPLAIWMIFVFLFIPFLNLGMSSLRTAFLNTAVKEAVHRAARSKTYELTDANGVSAKDLANTVARDAASRFGGLTVSTVRTAIIATDINSGVVVRSTDKLATAADTTKNLYQLEVRATAQVDPFFAFNLPFLGPIPGLTAPFPLEVAATEMVEDPDGLNK